MALTLYSSQGYPLTTAQLDANFSHVISIQRPVCGRLSNLVTQTGPIPGSDPFDSCHVVPYNGNQAFINGTLETIPDGAFAVSGGVIANYSSCYVDKVAGRSLLNNTFYYAYLWMNSGVMTLNFSTTGYTQNDSTYGMPLKSDDPTCTLVGILYCKYVGGIPTTYGGARGQTIAGYWNHFIATIETQISGSTPNNSATQLADGSTLANGQPQYNFVEWVQWYDHAPRVRAHVNVGNSVSGNRVNFGVGLQTRTAITSMTATQRVSSTDQQSSFLAVQSEPTDATGYYFAQALGYETEDAGAGTAYFDGRLHVDGVML